MSYAITAGARRTRRRRGPVRTAAVWLVKLATTAALGVAGYVFIWEVAPTAVVNSIVGR